MKNIKKIFCCIGLLSLVSCSNLGGFFEKEKKSPIVYEQDKDNAKVSQDKAKNSNIQNVYYYKIPQSVNVNIEDIDYKKTNIAFLIDGYSKIDTDKFKKTGKVSYLQGGSSVTYLGYYACDENDKDISGKKDVANKTVSLDLMVLLEQDIFNKTYSDLAVILGDKDYKDNTKFVNYRKIIPVKDSVNILPYKNIEEVKIADGVDKTKNE